MSDVEDDESAFEPWTPDGASRLRAVAQALAAAILAHAETVINAAEDEDAITVFAADDALRPAVVNYADAHFAFTGIGSLFDDVDDGADDVDDGADYVRVSDEGDDDPVVESPTPGITVLQRRDYAVVDEPAILAAGRAAYLHVWPHDDEASAARDVTHLGRALYQLAHAGEGFDDLDDLPGLVPTGGSVVVLRQETLLTGGPEDWPDGIFDVDGEQLYEMQDVYIADGPVVGAEDPLDNRDDPVRTDDPSPNR